MHTHTHTNRHKRHTQSELPEQLSFSLFTSPRCTNYLGNSHLNFSHSSLWLGNSIRTAHTRIMSLPLPLSTFFYLLLCTLNNEAIFALNSHMQAITSVFRLEWASIKLANNAKTLQQPRWLAFPSPSYSLLPLLGAGTHTRFSGNQ